MRRNINTELIVAIAFTVILVACVVGLIVANINGATVNETNTLSTVNTVYTTVTTLTR